MKTFKLIFEGKEYTPIDYPLLKLNWTKALMAIEMGNDVYLHVEDKDNTKYFFQPAIIKQCIIKYD